MNLPNYNWGDFFSSSNGRLKFDASGLPNSLTVDLSTGVISGTLVNDDVGEHVVIFTATNEEGISGSQQISFIEDYNDPPTLEEVQDAIINEDASFSYQLTASDIDADVVSETLSYDAVSKPVLVERIFIRFGYGYAVMKTLALMM